MLLAVAVRVRTRTESPDTAKGVKKGPFLTNGELLRSYTRVPEEIVRQGQPQPWADCIGLLAGDSPTSRKYSVSWYPDGIAQEMIPLVSMDDGVTGCWRGSAQTPTIYILPGGNT